MLYIFKNGLNEFLFLSITFLLYRSRNSSKKRKSIFVLRPFILSLFGNLIRMQCVLHFCSELKKIKIKRDHKFDMQSLLAIIMIVIMTVIVVGYT